MRKGVFCLSSSNDSSSLRRSRATVAIPAIKVGAAYIGGHTPIFGVAALLLFGD